MAPGSQAGGLRGPSRPCSLAHPGRTLPSPLTAPRLFKWVHLAVLLEHRPKARTGKAREDRAGIRPGVGVGEARGQMKTTGHGVVRWLEDGEGPNRRRKEKRIGSGE